MEKQRQMRMYPINQIKCTIAKCAVTTSMIIIIYTISSDAIQRNYHKNNKKKESRPKKSRLYFRFANMSEGHNVIVSVLHFYYMIRFNK